MLGTLPSAQDYAPEIAQAAVVLVDRIWRMPLVDGDVFAGYRIVRLLGAGGMGEVYLARHPRLPRHDALKILSKVSADREFQARFGREADLAATLYHPHIVGVHDRGETDGQLWISMDYVDGTDAARLIGENYPSGMPLDVVVSIVSAVAAGLDYAHERGLLHRDVKPANILVTNADRDGHRRVLLADFGIARQIADPGDLTATNFAVGTVAYAAPEQLIGAAIDGRADQYALAATAFHLLTGMPPYEHSNPVAVISKHLTSEPPLLSGQRPELAQLDEVFTTALAKDPDHRYERCGAFARTLADCLQSATAPEHSAISGREVVAPEPGSSATRARLRWRYTGIRIPALIAVTAIVFAVVAFMAVRFGSTGTPPQEGSPSSRTPGSSAPVPGGPLDGIYRMDTDQMRMTMNGQLSPNTDIPTNSDWIAFRSACTPAGCVARGTSLDYTNHQVAAVPQGTPIVFHFNDGQWQSPSRQGPSTCMSNKQVVAANTLSSQISLTPQPDGSLQGTLTSTILTNECAGQGAFMTSPVIMMRVGEVPSGVDVADPSAPENASPATTTAPPGPTGPINVGAPCLSLGKLALDSNRQSVLCRDTVWQAAPRFAGLNASGAPCAHSGEKSITGDGYMLNCYPDTRTWGLYK